MGSWISLIVVFVICMILSMAMFFLGLGIDVFTKENPLEEILLNPATYGIVIVAFFLCIYIFGFVSGKIWQYQREKKERESREKEVEEEGEEEEADTLEYEQKVWNEFYSLNQGLLEKFVIKNWDVIKESRCYSIVVDNPDNSVGVVNKIFPSGKLIVEMRQLLDLIQAKSGLMKTKPTEMGLLSFLNPIIDAKFRDELKRKITSQNPQTLEEYIDGFIYAFHGKYSKRDLHYFISILTKRFPETFSEYTTDQILASVPELVKKRIKLKKLERYEQELLSQR